jgi:hypothetical protein
MTHDFDSSREDDSDLQGNDVPPDTPLVRARGSSLWRLPIAGGSVLVIVAVVLALLALLQLVPGQSTASRQAESTSTATPIPRVLYTADWSRHGTDGWTLPSHWRLFHGHIENDGYGTEPLLIPYQVTMPTYSVAVDFTVLFSTQTFSVQVQGNNNVDFCPGIACLANVVSTTPLSPLHIAIYDVGVQMSISRIVISRP